METNVNYTIVGAFVIGLVLAITIAVIWLSSGFSFETYTTYMVYMQESVSGLNLDAPVEYNGVGVGTVKSIQLNRKNPQLVEVLLSIKSSTPVTKGTTAMLSTRGITGVTFVALQDKSTDLRPLVANPGQPYPVIKTIPSLFMRLDTALSELNKNFHEIAEAFQSVFDKETRLAIKETLVNLRSVTANLADNNAKITRIFENTSKASQQFPALMQSSTGVMKMLEIQTMPVTYQVLSNLNNAARNLSDLSAEIKQNPSILIRGVNRQALGPGETK